MVHKSNSERLRRASTSIEKFLGSPYLKHLNVPRTAEVYEAIVDPPDETDDKSGPRVTVRKYLSLGTNGHSSSSLLFTASSLKPALCRSPQYQRWSSIDTSRCLTVWSSPEWRV